MGIEDMSDEEIGRILQEDAEDALDAFQSREKVDPFIYTEPVAVFTRDLQTRDAIRRVMEIKVSNALHLLIKAIIADGYIPDAGGLRVTDFKKPPGTKAFLGLIKWIHPDKRS